MIRAGECGPARIRALSHEERSERIADPHIAHLERTAVLPRAHHSLPTADTRRLERLTLPPALILQKHGERIRPELTRVHERVFRSARGRRMGADEMAHGNLRRRPDPRGMPGERIGMERVRFRDAWFFRRFGGRGRAGGGGGLGVIRGGFFLLRGCRCGRGAFTFRGAVGAGSRGGVARVVVDDRSIRLDGLDSSRPASYGITLGRHRLRRPVSLEVGGNGCWVRVEDWSGARVVGTPCGAGREESAGEREQGVR